VRVALVGRPNVGKSSILNRLVGEERVVVSDVPGTTRDAIDVRVEHAGERFLLVDTAGLRRAGRRTQSAEHGSALMTVRALERANVALVVIDAVDGATDQDARIASLSLERGCAVGLLVNKWDLVAGRGEAQIGRLLDEVRRRLRFLGDAPLLTVSAKTGAGIGRIFELSQRLAAAVERRIGTAELNRWLSQTVALHDPAMAQRGPRLKPVKFYYATQLGTRPPTFVLFCSEPDAVQSSYRRFLENQLRESFGLAGAPVRLRLRSRR
jgi:GTP-binding protein